MCVGLVCASSLPIETFCLWAPCTQVAFLCWYQSVCQLSFGIRFLLPLFAVILFWFLKGNKMSLTLQSIKFMFNCLYFQSNCSSSCKRGAGFHVHCQVMHVGMRDGLGNVIPVQVFHIALFDLKGEARHLVGVRHLPEIEWHWILISAVRNPKVQSAQAQTCEFAAAQTWISRCGTPQLPQRQRGGLQVNMAIKSCVPLTVGKDCWSLDV